MDEQEPTLGQRLRQRRLERRVWQRDLAAAARLSKGYLSQLERDQARAAEPTLRRLALALGLEELALVEQAVREGRLARTSGRRGRRVDEPVTEAPAGIPIPAPRPVPRKAWLTTTEAAAAMGLSAERVRVLIRRGRLRPARRIKRAGEKGPKRWLVSATAALAYRSPQEGYAKPRPAEPPEGFMGLRAFSAAADLSHGALHRRLEAGAIASVRLGRRRFIPEHELERLLGEKGACG